MSRPTRGTMSRPTRTRSRGPESSQSIAPLQALPELPPPAQLLPPDVDVGLFWDYENMPIGARFSFDALTSLLQRACSLGRLVEARLYADAMKGDKAAFGKHGAMLNSVGVTLVDCPTSDKKEAVDKKMIVDACCFALPRAAQRQPCCVILVTSDGDFAHLLSRLSYAGVNTVAIGRSAALRAVCHTALTMQQVCGAEGPCNGSTSALHGSPSPSKKKRKRAGDEAADGGHDGGGSPLPSKKKRKRARDEAAGGHDGGGSSSLSKKERKRVGDEAAGAGTAPEAVAGAPHPGEVLCGQLIKSSQVKSSRVKSSQVKSSRVKSSHPDEVLYGQPVRLRFVACDRMLSVEANGGVCVTHPLEPERVQWASCSLVFESRERGIHGPPMDSRAVSVLTGDTVALCTYVPAHGLAGDQSNVDGDQREALHLDVQPLGKTVAVAGRRSHSKGEVRANPPRLPVHARWNDRTGAWQAIRIEDGSTKSKPRPLRWGDRIYLSSVAGAGPAPHLHADPTVPDEERRCVAQWHDRGVWQEVEVLRALATP